MFVNVRHALVVRAATHICHHRYFVLRKGATQTARQLSNFSRINTAVQNTLVHDDTPQAARTSDEKTRKERKGKDGAGQATTAAIAHTHGC